VRGVQRRHAELAEHLRKILESLGGFTKDRSV
jgi:hypothetical protein